MNLNRISVIVTTWNEERNIARCLEALRWCEQIVVVDGGSLLAMS